jgi:hypothetical protein
MVSRSTLVTVAITVAVIAVIMRVPAARTAVFGM